MTFVFESLKLTILFVLLFYLTFEAEASSKIEGENSITSAQITTNDPRPLLENELFAKFKASFSRSLTQGYEIGTLDHNTLISNFNNVVNPPSKTRHFVRKSPTTSTVTSNLVTYLSKETYDYKGEQRTLTNQLDASQEYPFVASPTVQHAPSTISSNEPVSLTVDQQLGFPNKISSNDTIGNFIGNITSEKSDAANPWLMQKLIPPNDTR